MTDAPTLGYTPFPKQRIFHAAPAAEKFYGGSAGPGKSRALEEELSAVCYALPGLRGIFLRRSFPELEEVESDLEELLPAVATYNKNNHLWDYHRRVNPYDGKPAASFLKLSHMVTENDKYEHLSKQYGIIAFDEASLFTPTQIEYLLLTRNRTPVAGRKALGLPRTLMGSNPGGPAHLWLKERYVTPTETEAKLIAYWDAATVGPDGLPGWWARFPESARGEAMPRTSAPDGQYGWWMRTDDGTHDPYYIVVWEPHPTAAHLVENENRAKRGLPPLPIPTRVFVPALLEDNPIYYDSGEYEAKLLSIPDEKLRRALRYGDWDAFEGMFFSTFDARLHVTTPISPPPHWRKWGSLDWGAGKDSAIVYQWHTQDPTTEQVITYRELHYRGDTITDRQFCEQVISLSQHEHVDYTLADPSMFHGGNREHATTLAQEYHRFGLTLQPANNHREQGWGMWKNLMAINPLTATPGWVVTSNCVNLIRTIPMQTFHPKNPNDMLKNPGDHDCDCARYGVNAAARVQSRWTEAQEFIQYARR